MSTWLITGCSTGLGRALAEAVLDRGDHAVITARDVQSLADLAKAYPDTALALGLDVTNDEQVTAAVRQAQDVFGGVDVLVNNAGYGYRAAVEEGDPADVQRLFATNFFGPVTLIKAVLPGMRARRSGAIVNISSISALRPRGLTTYTTSKAAVIGLSQAMAVDHGRDNIRVNCICPGPMYTPMVYAHGNGMSETARAQRANASVLKTEGTGWDVGQAVKFLLSNHARYITGQVLVVDGGVTLQAPERESQPH